MQATAQKIESSQTPTPYSMSVDGAAAHFGYKPKTFKNWIYAGKLQRGRHYKKVDNKVLIIIAAMIEFLIRRMAVAFEKVYNP